MDEDVQFTCPCYDVSGESFRALIEQGITDVRKIQELTGAGLGCGMCEDRMFMVIQEAVASGEKGKGRGSDPQVEASPEWDTL